MIKTAWRNLLNSKRLWFINIPGLTIGMAAAFLVLLWVQNEFSFDIYQPDANREYLVTWMNKNKEINADGSPFPLAQAATRSIPGLEGVTCYYPHGFTNQLLHINSQVWPEKNFTYADTNWFGLFHYEFLAGNADGFGLKNGIIMTAALAEKYFGHKTAVGQIVRIDSTDYSVLGVIRNNPVNSSFQFDLFLPLQTYFSDPNHRFSRKNWRAFSARTFIRLKPGVSANKCAKELDELVKANSESDAAAKLIPLTEMHFGVGLPSTDIIYGDKKVAIIFGCLGALLLFIACINYVNMTTATASIRIKEISMKKIMGATRMQLFVQFMGEALLTGIVALLFTLIIVWLALPSFNRLAETHFVFSFANRSVLTIILGVWLLSILFTGIYPAIMLSANDPLRLLRSNYLPHASIAWVRKTLVVLQFTAAIALIIGTVTIITQLKYIQDQNEGYDRAQIFSIQLPPPTWFKQNGNVAEETLLQTFKTELLRQAAIEHATYLSGSVMDMTVSMAGIADWDGRDPNFNPLVYPLNVDPDFCNLFQLRLVSGKWFSAGNVLEKNNYILNETAAETFGLHQPWVGQRFTMLGDTGRVIGIVKDFHFRTFHEKIAPMVLVNDAPWKSTLFVKIASHGAPAAIQAASRLFHRFFPDQAFEYTFLDAAFDKLYRSDIRTSQLVGCFAGIAILLSCLGLLGLTTFTARQREKEIATRKILGASVGHIIGRLSGEFLRLVIIALLIACPIGWWATHKWLQGFAYRMEISWWMFMFAGCVAIAIAFLTIAIQAIKAAIASPVKSLRNQ